MKYCTKCKRVVSNLPKHLTRQRCEDQGVRKQDKAWKGKPYSRVKGKEKYLNDLNKR